MKLRHMGLIAKNQETLKFYESLGFKFKPKAIEFWKDKRLEIYKGQNQYGEVIELIVGDWKPHISLTSDKHPNYLWEKYAGKADQILTTKKKDDLFIVYLKDPSGNYVEVVHDNHNI